MWWSERQGQLAASDRRETAGEQRLTEGVGAAELLSKGDALALGKRLDETEGL